MGADTKLITVYLWVCDRLDRIVGGARPHEEDHESEAALRPRPSMHQSSAGSSVCAVHKQLPSWFQERFSTKLGCSRFMKLS
jgi:hypothetical protein